MNDLPRRGFLPPLVSVTGSSSSAFRFPFVSAGAEMSTSIASLTTSAEPCVAPVAGTDTAGTNAACCSAYCAAAAAYAFSASYDAVEILPIYDESALTRALRVSSWAPA
jgi:hypothetical protein